VRSKLQRTPDIFVLLLYVRDMPDVYDTLLQEFEVVQFYVVVYLQSFCNCSRNQMQWKRVRKETAPPLKLTNFY
jgi:hypothetical protein